MPHSSVAAIAIVTVMVLILGSGCGPSAASGPPPAAVAGPAFPSNELLSIERWLESRGTRWRLFYDSIQDKKYQWLIRRSVAESGVHYQFSAGREIDDAGRVIGDMCPYSDQFFSLRLDLETSEVEEMYGLGG